VVIHLANRSVACPAGFIEDVLVRVGELIFPVDFYILNMEEKISLLPGPRPSEKIFQVLDNSVEKAYMNTGRDLKNYVPVALTTKFHSSFFSNIFMKDSTT